MNILIQWGGSLLVAAVYAYVLGTGLWLLLVAPRIHKRQWQMLKRLDALERRLAELTSVRSAT
jgi:hypothetical protein